MSNAQTPINLNLPQGCAVVIGASGGLGRALLAGVETSGIDGQAIGLSRHASPAIDLTSEATIEACAQHVAAQGAPLRLLIIATGILHDEAMKPERSLRDLSPEQLARAFAINTIGPALVNCQEPSVTRVCEEPSVNLTTSCARSLGLVP
jgi:NAD(P)-dependent dehydrogenase (short-subunit alcohol dehydrogenase family)